MVLSESPLKSCTSCGRNTATCNTMDGQDQANVASRASTLEGSDSSNSEATSIFLVG